MSKTQVINALVRTETEVSIKINPSLPYSTLMKEFPDIIKKGNFCISIMTAHEQNDAMNQNQ